MNNASDFGYPNGGERPISVRPNDTFRQHLALGIAEYRVVRRHRQAGYWEVVFSAWVTPVEAYRQGFVGTLDVMANRDILDAMRAA